uniref:Uncharacterized protein n=1 Tax=Glossina austeni TaxID=7395 RepID=A0A1A9VIJ0_GLOAU
MNVKLYAIPPTIQNRKTMDWNALPLYYIYKTLRRQAVQRIWQLDEITDLAAPVLGQWHINKGGVKSNIVKSEKCRYDEGLLLLPSKIDELITADNAGAVPDLGTLPCRAFQAGNLTHVHVATSEAAGKSRGGDTHGLGYNVNVTLNDH